MNIVDVGVIVIGLIAGWVLVSKLFGTKPPSTALTDDLPTDDGEPWYVVLEVGADSSSDDIRRAYEQKAAELARMTPGILTETEMHALTKKKTRIESAYRTAIQERNDTNE